jgi:ParB-like chromosome segregation protein Spo0J
MRASIAEFGFRQPIVVDGRPEAIAGHSRLEAALLKGNREIDSDQIH